MRCPNCSSQMVMSRKVSDQDGGKTIAENNLCPNCFKRILTFAPNYHYTLLPTRDEPTPQRRAADARFKILDKSAEVQP